MSIRAVEMEETTITARQDCKTIGLIKEHRHLKESSNGYIGKAYNIFNNC